MYVAGALGERARKQRWFEPGRSELSVVLMNGGRLYVPPIEYSDLLEAYSRDVAQGISHYIIERVTPKIHWYADIDIITKEGLGSSEVFCIASTVAYELRALGLVSHVIALVAEPKAKDSNVKTGIHLVAPSVQVTPEHAAEIRDSLLIPLTKKCAAAINGWDDAFDNSVYKNGSLRLVMSRKMEACMACKGDSDKTCGTCRGSRRVDIGRAYSLLGVMNSFGERDADWERTLSNNVQLLVKKSSIRVPSSQEGMSSKKERARKAAAPAQAVKRPLLSNTDGMTIQELLHNSSDCPSAHGALVVRDVKHSEHEVYIRVHGIGERYCSNVCRNHTTSQIWFLCQANSLYQCCFSHKACRNYRGVPMRISQRGAMYLGLSKPSGLPDVFA